MPNAPSGSQAWYLPGSNEPGTISEEDDLVQPAFAQLSNRMKELKNGLFKINDTLDVITREDLQETLVKVKNVYEGQRRPRPAKVEVYLTKLI